MSETERYSEEKSFRSSFETESEQFGTMHDGTIVDIDNARSAVDYIYQAIVRKAGRNLSPITTLLKLRLLTGDDVAAYINEHPDKAMREDLGHQLNYALGARIIDLEPEDPTDLVGSPEAAMAVFRNMVVVERTEAGEEVWLQEPFAGAEENLALRVLPNLADVYPTE